jgi:hypothetical protein
MQSRLRHESSTARLEEGPSAHGLSRRLERPCLSSAGTQATIVGVVAPGQEGGMQSRLRHESSTARLEEGPSAHGLSRRLERPCLSSAGTQATIVGVVAPGLDCRMQSWPCH